VKASRIDRNMAVDYGVSVASSRCSYIWYCTRWAYVWVFDGVPISTIRNITEAERMYERMYESI